MTTQTRDNTRKLRIFPYHVALLCDKFTDTESKTFNQANDHTHWVDSMSKEYAALLSNGTWDLVPSSLDQNVVGCKWVFKVKQRADGTLERYKAQLVTKGFHQEEGVDFFEIYSPIVRLTTI